MKRSAYDHPKIRRLAKLLKIRRCFARGIMESIWHFTAQHAPKGDIGRWEADELCDAIDWPLGEWQDLVDALIQCRLLDAHPEHRLLVHDWFDHADDSVHTALARETLRFADGRIPKLTKFNLKERPIIEEAYRRASENLRGAEMHAQEHSGAGTIHGGAEKPAPFLAFPSLAFPSQAKPDTFRDDPEFDPVVAETWSALATIATADDPAADVKPIAPRKRQLSDWLTHFTADELIGAFRCIVNSPNEKAASIRSKWKGLPTFLGERCPDYVGLSKTRDAWKAPTKTRDGPPPVNHHTGEIARLKAEMKAREAESRQAAK